MRGHLPRLYDYKHIHRCPDELRRRDFHGLRRSLNTKDLWLHRHRRVDNLVDVLLRDLDMLGRLVQRRRGTCRCGISICLVACLSDGRGTCRCITIGIAASLVDVLRLRNFDVLGRLSEEGFHGRRQRRRRRLNLRDLSLHHRRRIDIRVDT